MKKEFIINDRENKQRFRISANAEKIYIREENPEYPFNTIGRVAVNKKALIQAEENVNDVDRMLYGLTDEEIELLEMIYWDKLPVRAIAEALIITIPGVYWRRNHILDKMAERL